MGCDPLPGPWQIKCIYLNEAAERFCFYAARGILVLYLGALGFTDGESISIYSYYIAAAYFAPLIGGYVSDVYLGRYRTIVSFNALYLVGLAVLAGTAFVNSLPGCLAGLLLMAIGTGGIKPCVGVFGADQLRDLSPSATSSFWLTWYACINLGALLSYIVTPIIQDRSGFGWAFMMSFFTLLASVLVFLIPSGVYVRKPAAGVSAFASVWAVVVASAASWEMGEDPLPPQEASPGTSSSFSATPSAAAADMSSSSSRVSKESTPLMFSPSRRSGPLGKGVVSSAAAGGGGGPSPYSAAGEEESVPLSSTEQQNELFLSSLGGGPESSEAAATAAMTRGGAVSSSSSDDDEEARTAAAVAVMLQQVAGLPRPTWTSILLWGPWGVGPLLPRSLLSCCVCGRARRDRPRWSMEQARGIIPDQFIDGVTAVTGIFPLFAMLPMFWALHDAQDSIWQIQRKSMNTCITDSFCISVPQLGVVNPILCVIFVSMLDKVIPVLYRWGLNPTPLRRMSVGMQVAACSYLLAAGVQAAVDSNPANSISVLWQLGQITVVTIAEMLVSASGLEFAYGEAPKFMRGTIMALFFASSAVGDTISGILYSALSTVASPLQLLLLLSALMCLAGIGFALLAARYVPLHAQEAASKSRAAAAAGLALGGGGGPAATASQGAV